MRICYINSHSIFDLVWIKQKINSKEMHEDSIGSCVCIHVAVNCIALAV